MRARYERYDKHGKKRRLILFSLLGVALSSPYSLRPFPGYPGKTVHHGQTDFGKKGHHYRQGGTHENAARPSCPSQQAGIDCSGKTAGVFRRQSVRLSSYRSETIPFGKTTLSRAIRRMGFEENEICPHGFRAMASTPLNELGYNRDWIERQLAHAPTDQIHRIKTAPNTCPNAAVCFRNGPTILTA